jgi:hypothetical protein
MNHNGTNPHGPNQIIRQRTHYGFSTDPLDFDLNEMQRLVSEEFDKVHIEKFIEQVEIYQSNHYGGYNRNLLAKRYGQLPDYFKKQISPKKSYAYWRGADGISGDYGAISFTDRRANAGFYGHYTIPFSELHSFTGVIDTGKLRAFIDKYKIDSDVGDDENEIIVIDPVWKPGLPSRLDNYVYSRA